MKHTHFLILVIITITGCSQSKTTLDEWDGGRKVIKEYSNYQDTTSYLRKFYYSNGQLGTEGNYIKGQMDGIWKWWYNNGQLMDSGKYVHGVSVGEFVHYHENGQLKSKQNTKVHVLVISKNTTLMGNCI